MLENQVALLVLDFILYTNWYTMGVLSVTCPFEHTFKIFSESTR